MKKIKTSDKKYPLKVVLNNGVKITIPKQSNFKNNFLHKHGCSIMAEYVALQFVGIHKWPIKLYKWHKKHTKNQIKSKVTLKGIKKGISSLGKKKCSAVYYEKVTSDRISNAIKNGCCIIMEQKNPIHSIALLPDKKGIYKVSYGTVKKVTAKGIAKTATTNSTYRGMIVIRRR